MIILIDLYLCSVFASFFLFMSEISACLDGGVSWNKYGNELYGNPRNVSSELISLLEFFNSD